MNYCSSPAGRIHAFSAERENEYFWKAFVRIGLDERNKALVSLGKATEEREAYLAFIMVWPQFDSLRSQSRFQAWLRKIDLDK